MGISYFLTMSKESYTIINIVSTWQSPHWSEACRRYNLSGTGFATPNNGEKH